MAEILVLQKRKEKSEETGQHKQAIRIVTEKREAEEAVQLNTYRLILIDLEGKEKEGIEFAFFVRGLREYGLTPILFFAGDREYEQLAFHEIHCYDYMVKPICEEEIIRILYLYLTHIPVFDEKRRMSFQVHGEEYVIPIQDIVYMEVMNRSIFVHTVSQILEVPYRKLCDCMACGEGEFIQCHRSCIVNRSYIRKIDYVNHKIELKDSTEKIDMGRKYERMLRHKFDG